jgi:hypothetical protein
MTQTSHTRSALIKLSLVDDSPGDVRRTRKALQDTKTQVSLNIVSDGTGPRRLSVVELPGNSSAA